MNVIVRSQINEIAVKFAGMLVIKYGTYRNTMYSKGTHINT